MGFPIFCHAVFLLILAPFRGAFRAICRLFASKPKRSMRNEIVLVTGSANGLGRGITMEMARLGATVVCWDINESGNLETAAMATKVSPRERCVHAYRCDISNREQVLSVAERVKKEVGNVTMLINNAGILTAGRIEKYRPDDIIKVVNTNLISHFWTIEAFLPHMKSINRGQIVCISSMSALMDSEFLVLYSATKYGVTGLMEALGEELTRTNYDKIRLTTVYPTYTLTSPKMKVFENNGVRLMDASSVAKEIVHGAIQNKREFSIPSWLMPIANFLRFYPRDVRRAWRYIDSAIWVKVVMESPEPLTS